MTCQRCKSERILDASSHARDLHCVSINGADEYGYLPYDLGIGGGDDMEINVCLDCGQLQGDWPLPVSELEQKVLVKETDKKSKFWTCLVCNWNKNLHIADTCDDCNAPNPMKDRCQQCKEVSLQLTLVDDSYLCPECEDEHNEKLDRELHGDED